MKRRLVTIAIAVLLAVPLVAVQNINDLYQQGLAREDAGDLKGAIQIFERIVQEKEFAGDRPLVAKALVQLAQWYELLGKNQAQGLYQRVLTEYPDQTKAVSDARKNLAPAAPAPALERFLSVNRDGTGIEAILPPGNYGQPALSPDGQTLAFRRRVPPNSDFDIWTMDLGSREPRRFTTDPGNEDSPLWAPDGGSIVYYSNRVGNPGLYRKDANGTGREELLLRSTRWMAGYYWTADGRSIVCNDTFPATSWDTMLLSLADLSYTPLLQATSGESDGAISPDGRWLAYGATDTGRYEIYVTTYPPSAKKWTITTNGGVDPLWSKNGRELYYVNSDTEQLMRIEMTETENGFVPGPQQIIYAGRLTWDTLGRSFAVMPDEQRFIVWPRTAQ